jgi:hypothetical protein
MKKTRTPTDRFIFVGDIVEANGKTIRENNQERPHKFALGTLVEIHGSEDFGWNGCRLYVRSLSRDCDGSPLYVLGSLDLDDRPTLFGMDEEGMREVKP